MNMSFFCSPIFCNIRKRDESHIKHQTNGFQKMLLLCYWV